MGWIDISQTLNAQTPVYPGDDAVGLQQARTPQADGFTAFRLCTGLHAGTHVDAPMHLMDDGRFISHFPMEAFTGPGVLLDLRGQAELAMRPEYEACVTPGSVVLLYTGHDRLYGTAEYFSAHPGVGKALGDFLLSRNIRMLGMDMPSPDHPPFAFHKALLREGIFVLENLTNLGALLGAGAFEVMAFPLKIDAEASLLRAVCRLP